MSELVGAGQGASLSDSAFCACAHYIPTWKRVSKTEWKNVVPGDLSHGDSWRDLTEISSAAFPDWQHPQNLSFLPPALWIIFIKVKESLSSCAPAHWIFALKWEVAGHHFLCQIQAFGVWWMPESSNSVWKSSTSSHQETVGSKLHLGLMNEMCY